MSPASTTAQAPALDELIGEAVGVCHSEGLSPMAAAERVADLDVLDEHEILYAVQTYIAKGVSTELSRLRRRSKAREVQRAGKARWQGKNPAVSAMFDKITDVLARVVYQDVDGEERTLMLLSREGHRMQLRKAQATAEDALSRSGFHSLAVQHMSEHEVTRIADLPPEVVENLRGEAEGVWG